MKKFSIYLIAASLAFSFASPINAYADLDPVQAQLAAKLPKLPLPPNPARLITAHQQVGADWTIANGYTGQGVSVAVMDEGTQSLHEQLKGRIIEEVCTSSVGNQDPRLTCPNKKIIDVGVGAAEYTKKADGTPYQWADHGTMVSSGVLEFAPDVRIISIKSHGDHIGALNWIIANAKKYNIAAVNMSFGGDLNERTYSKCSDDPGVADWKNAFKALKDLGVASVAASGNGGRTSSISHPACQETAISVGAVTPDDKVISYSNVSSKLTLLAPTEFEAATVPQDPKVLDSWIPSFGGTSAATPVIAALFAIGKSISPNSSVDELVDVARSTSTSVDDSIVKDLRRVNFDKFVKKLLGLKLVGDVKSISISKLELSNATLTWTSNTKPENFRLSIDGQKPLTFSGNVSEYVVERPTGLKRIKVKIEALDKEGVTNSYKEIEIIFPVLDATGWCNPNGRALDTMAPLLGHFTVLGPNKVNPQLIDFGFSLSNLGNHLNCTYVEMSPLNNPNFAYTTRLSSGTSTDRHTVVIPKDFGTGGIMRITFIDRDGNYSKVFEHVFPTNTFRLSSVDSYEAGLSRIATEIQPELIGALQKSMLAIDRIVETVSKESADIAQAAAVAKAKADAEVVQAAAVAKAKADAEVVQAAAVAKAKADAEVAQTTAIAKAKADAEVVQAAAVAKAKADAEVVQAAAVAKAKVDAEMAITAALAKARAEAEASIVAQNQVISQIQSEVESLKKLMSKKTTIICIKGKLTRSVTGVIPECPVGYKSKK